MQTDGYLRQGVNIAWPADPNVATHFCPDEKTPVTYEIRREIVG